MTTITHVYAGVPVSGLEASLDWYTRLFGRPPDHRVGEAMLWDVKVPGPDGNAIALAEPADGA